jgi:hypothetical protein
MGGYITYMPIAKKGGEGKKQQARWPEAVVALDRLSVRLANQRRRHVPLVAALERDQMPPGHHWPTAVTKECPE